MADPVLPSHIGKYEIMSILGQGGMGVVYQARDPLLDRVVAIKTIQLDSDESSKDLVARLTQEARSAGRLHHPNIVTIFDFGSDGELTYLVMEYVEGKNLASVISKRLAVPLARRLEMIIQLCNALTYAHELGVTHRDIKPANICLTSKEIPKLLDFGLARFDDTRLTRTGFTSGTVAYMSPERMRGAVGTSDDVFAMAVVAYEFLTYANAFPGKNYGEIVSKILSGRFPVPPSRAGSLPAQLDPIFARALAPNPEDRYASAADFARELDRFRLSPELANFAAQEAQNSVASADELMTPSSGDHPYSAPEAGEIQEGPTSISVKIGTDALDPFHFAPTETEMRAVVPEQGQDENLPTQAFDALRHGIGATALATNPKGQVRDPVVVVARAAPPVDPVVAVARPEPPIDPTIAVPRPAREEVSGTMLTRFTEKFRQMPGAATVSTGGKEKSGILRLAGELAPLAIAVAAAPLLNSVAGPFGYLGAYAIATILWFRLLKRLDAMGLKSVLLLAVLLRLLTLTTSPGLTRSGIPNLSHEPGVSADSSTPSTREPTAPLAYVLAVVASSFGGVFLWRLMLMAADLVMVWLLWDPQRPRLSLSWATFPFIILGGFWRGHVELLAAAVLMAAFLWARQNHEATGGLALGVAAGLTPLAFVSLPVVSDVAVRVERMVVGLVVVLSLVYLLGGRSTVRAPLGEVARSSVTLSAACDALEKAIGSTSFVPSTRHVAENAMHRANLGPSTVTRWRDRISARSTAGLVMLVATWILLTLVSKRSDGPEAGMSNCTGLFLIAAVCLQPAGWLLVAPFALLARQRSWIMIVAFAPLLDLVQGTGIVDYLVFGLSVILPLLVVGAIKLRNTISLKSGKPLAQTAEA